MASPRNCNRLFTLIQMFLNSMKSVWAAMPKGIEISTGVAAATGALMYWDTQYGRSAKATAAHRLRIQEIHEKATLDSEGYQILQLKMQCALLKMRQEEANNRSKWWWSRTHIDRILMTAGILK